MFFVAVDNLGIWLIWLLFCCVQVKNTVSKVILSRHYAAEGRFTFTSHESGEHVICIGTNSTRWFGGNKLVSGKER